MSTMQFAFLFNVALLVTPAISFSVRLPLALRMVGSGWDDDRFGSSLSADNVEGEVEGGTRFKEMMARARDSNPNYNRPPSYSQQPSPSVDLNKLSTEEQAALFRQFMANSATGAAPVINSGPTRVLPGGVAADGRRVGRNRDADTIANAGDVYLEQLKRDSTVRTRARYDGDLETAEAIFEDESVKEIANAITTNPFLDQEDTAEEMALMGTVAEELAIIRNNLKSVPPVDVTTAGVRYKEKLNAKRAKKTAPSLEVQQISESVVQQAVAPVVQQAVAPVVQQVIKPVVQRVVEPVVPQVVTPVAQQAVEPQQNVRPTRSVEESRQDIRRLQGLLLKHRGGSGFGSGLLRGEEVNTFETTLQDVITCLRGEAHSNVVATPAIRTPAAAVAVTNGGVPSVDTSAPTMGPTLACVEGAILMYKNSPVEMQSIMMPTLRAALLAAVTTCTTVIGDSGAPALPASADIMPSLACVEGAVLMYKNSPTEMQPIVVPTLRATLVAAVKTCDQVMGGMSPQQAPAAVVATAAVVAPVVAAPEPAGPIATSPQIGNDSNSQFLQGVYNSLQAASGGEKYGLKHLSPAEAGTLANQVYEMKSMIVEELSSGIPEPVASSTTSRYQEMLAKARADKAAGK